MKLFPIIMFGILAFVSCTSKISAANADSDLQQITMAVSEKNYFRYDMRDMETKKPKTFTRIININYKELVKTMAKLDMEDPQRTHGELDMLMDNIKNFLMKYLIGDYLIVQFDDDSGMAYIHGQPIKEDINDLPRIGCSEERSSSVKLWFQIYHSLEESKLYGAYEKIFPVFRVGTSKPKDHRDR